MFEVRRANTEVRGWMFEVRRSPKGTPTRVFLQKRLQAVENKRWERGKERKERTKRRQTTENMGFATPTGSGQAETRRHRVEN